MEKKNLKYPVAERKGGGGVCFHGDQSCTAWPLPVASEDHNKADQWLWGSEGLWTASLWCTLHYSHFNSDCCSALWSYSGVKDPCSSHDLARKFVCKVFQRTNLWLQHIHGIHWNIPASKMSFFFFCLISINNQVSRGLKNQWNIL